MRLCSDGQCLDSSNMCRAYNTDATHQSMQYATLKSALDSKYALSHSCSIDAVTKKAKHQTLFLCDKNSCLTTDSNHNPTFCKRMSDQNQVTPQVVETVNAQQLTSLLGMGYHNLPCSFCEIPETKAPTPTASKCPSANTQPPTASKCPSAKTQPPTASKCPSAKTLPPTASKCPSASPTIKLPTVPPVATKITPKSSCSSDPGDASTPVLSSNPTSSFPVMCPTVESVPETCSDNTCSTFPPQPKPKTSCDQ